MRERREWSRRYPPLSGALMAVLLSVFVLPSALNVPQSNPTQTLEFAPVPPDDQDQPPPPQGNTASLGLGSSSTTIGETLSGDGPGVPPPIPDGVGEQPVTKRCVGNPPRQTEDPLAPPCVAHFEGDNGGVTYQGASREEIVVLLYFDCIIMLGDRGMEDNCGETGQMIDLAEPPAPDEHLDQRNARRFQRYFNDRYQTYGRFVHFYAYIATFDDNDQITSETRRADIAQIMSQITPFAALTSGTNNGFEDLFAEEMAKRGVLTFGSAGGSREASFYGTFPAFIWSYAPTIETRARLYADLVCNHVVPYAVADSRDPESLGQPRRLGFLRTTDPKFPNLQRFAELTRTQIEACGGRFEVERTFPQAGRVGQQGGDDPAALYASQNVAAFDQRGVTTVIWAGGYETDHSKAADNIGYFPEWIIGGDGLHEGRFAGRYQRQAVWEHAWVISPVTLAPEDDARDPCKQALREADPTVGTQDELRACSSAWYPDLRQLFTGIQVAGPRLQPGSVDRGFHAIPAVPSTDPLVPACYYLPGDYTCVKDAVIMAWDSGNGVENQYGNDGCWRMVLDGQRFIEDGWPDGNIDAAAEPDDICNTYSPTVLLF
ncbi:MAG TPA: hypothetical protein VGA36_10290 [Nitriliruptorales bacterium]